MQARSGFRNVKKEFPWHFTSVRGQSSQICVCTITLVRNDLWSTYSAWRFTLTHSRPRVRAFVVEHVFLRFLARVTKGISYLPSLVATGVCSRGGGRLYSMGWVCCWFDISCNCDEQSVCGSWCLEHLELFDFVLFKPLKWCAWERIWRGAQRLVGNNYITRRCSGPCVGKKICPKLWFLDTGNRHKEHIQRLGGAYGF